MRTILPAIILALGACGDPNGTRSNPGTSSPPAAGSPAKSAVISKGSKFSSRDYLLPGYVTVLDFYADW